MSKKTLLLTTCAAPGCDEIIFDEKWYEGKVAAVVRNRHELTDDYFGKFLENALGFAFCTLKSCKPLIEEMKRRFKNLERSKHKDGSYSTIRGCRSFQEWCTKVLHRTEQAVYAMLREPKPKAPKPQELTPPSTADNPAPNASTVSNVGESLPVLKRRNGDGTMSLVPPAEYSPADAVESAKKFIDSLVQRMSAADAAIVYRGLVMELEDRLNQDEAADKAYAEWLRMQPDPDHPAMPWEATLTK